MAKQFKPETLCVQAGWTPKKGEPRVLPAIRVVAPYRHQSCHGNML